MLLWLFVREGRLVLLLWLVLRYGWRDWLFHHLLVVARLRKVLLQSFRCGWRYRLFHHLLVFARLRKVLLQSCCSCWPCLCGGCRRRSLGLRGRMLMYGWRAGRERGLTCACGRLFRL